MNNKKTGTAGLVAMVAAMAASAAAPQGADRVIPGGIIVEPSTLQALGLEWPLSGDANRNATVSVRYRSKGTEVFDLARGY